MEWFKEFFGLLAALAGIITVALQYLAARRDRTSTPSSSPLEALKLAKDRETPFLSTRVRPTKWVPVEFVLWLVLLVFFVLYLVYVLSGRPFNDSLYAFNISLFVVYIAWAYCMIIGRIAPLTTLVRARFNGPPWARRKAEVVVAGTDMQAVQDQCVVALRRMGATLVEIDSADGIVKAAKLPSRFWSTRLVDYITIFIISRDDKDRIQITIESDGVRASFSTDRRRNASNVNKFIDHLVG